MPRAENRKKVPGPSGRDQGAHVNPHGGGAHGTSLSSQQKADKQALVEKMKRLQAKQQVGEQTQESGVE
ncbi:MAG: hypothetical protein OWU32_02530 [Firmicutes bacterium]|nr:hypothetical protein [Bacillota bacterium]